MRMHFELYSSGVLLCCITLLAIVCFQTQIVVSSLQTNPTSNENTTTNIVENERNILSNSNVTNASFRENVGQKKQKTKKLGECEYEKGFWEECQSNGIQRRTLKLKDDSSKGSSNKCEPIKTIERECKLVGCKYARGEWSNWCKEGKRSRVDTLLGALGPSKTAAANEISRCPTKRIVSKECGKACHYIKSAWSECSNGFKTRNLTLDSSFSSSAPDAATSSDLKDEQRSSVFKLEQQQQQLQEQGGCAKERVIRRQCRLRELNNKQAQDTKQQKQQRQLSSSAGKSPPTKTILTAPQKRRLQKQQKLIQQQQQKTTTNNNNNNNNTINGEPSSMRFNGPKRNRR